MKIRSLAAALVLAMLCLGWAVAAAETDEDAAAEWAATEYAIELATQAEAEGASVELAAADDADDADADESDPDATGRDPDEKTDRQPDRQDGPGDPEAPIGEDGPLDEDAPAHWADPALEDDPGDADAPDEGSEVSEPSDAGEAPGFTAEDIDPRDCQHPVTVVALNRDGADVGYEDLNNGTHRITGRSVAVMLCADCGMVIQRWDSYVEPCAYERREGYGTVCTRCGHIQGVDGTHTHHFSGAYQAFPGALIASTPDPDAPEMYHINRFEKRLARKCDACEAYEAPQTAPNETIDVREAHDWGSDGVCRLCGQVRDCRHDGETFENEWVEDESFTFVNASIHARTAMQYVQRCCARCGQPLGNAEVRPLTEHLPHRFVDGRCEDCGYVNLCDHRNMRRTYDIDGSAAEYTAVDALMHRVRGGVFVTSEYCPDCGIRRTNLREAVPEGREIAQPHRFNAEGVCEDCGYAAPVPESACEHPESARVAIDPTDVSALKQSCRFEVVPALGTETTHVLRVAYDPSWVCSLCGHREDLSASTRTITVPEPHCFDHGYCVTANCGYKCPHDDIEGETATGAPYYESDGAAGHCLVTPVVATGRCRRCGETVRNHVVDVQRGATERHSMEDGVCRTCGYACPHPAEDIVELLPTVRALYSQFNAESHFVYEERVTETICLACGYTLFEEAEQMGVRVEAHQIRDGACVKCGWTGE